jgi:hypothetical protein
MVTLVFDISDWPRHQEDCIPAMSPTNRYNVNMIATPPPAEPQFIDVSAVLFAPEEGELMKSYLLTASLRNVLVPRKTEHCHYSLSTIDKDFSRSAPLPS